MSLTQAFWDSSALIPLCVHQSQTARARALYKGNGIVVWWATSVEIISGLTRLERMGHIGRDEFLIGKQRAQELGNVWDSLSPAPGIIAQACALLEAYPLRAADALQLAAALENCEGNPAGHVFITADQRLADAARGCGFSVEHI
jgi:predicted nucleic acid-binding protein